MGESAGQNRTDKKEGKPYRPRRWYKGFLAVLRDQGIVRVACEAAGIARSVAYEAKKVDSIFSDAWDSAMEDAADLMEEEAKRRAEIGVLEPVFYQGQEVGQIRKFSDALLIFRLKGARPTKYRDNVKAEIDGTLGLHVVRAPMRLGLDEWKQQADLLRQMQESRRAAGQGPESGPKQPPE